MMKAMMYKDSGTVIVIADSNYNELDKLRRLIEPHLKGKLEWVDDIPETNQYGFPTLVRGAYDEKES